MTYGFKVKVAEGAATLESQHGDLPDGQFEITGHDDAEASSLSVSQRDPEGRFIGAAHHSRPARQPS